MVNSYSIVSVTTLFGWREGSLEQRNDDSSKGLFREKGSCCNTQQGVFDWKAIVKWPDARRHIQRSHFDDEREETENRAFPFSHKPIDCWSLILVLVLEPIHFDSNIHHDANANTLLERSRREDVRNHAQRQCGHRFWLFLYSHQLDSLPTRFVQKGNTISIGYSRFFSHRCILFYFAWQAFTNRKHSNVNPSTDWPFWPPPTKDFFGTSKRSKSRWNNGFS